MVLQSCGDAAGGLPTAWGGTDWADWSPAAACGPPLPRHLAPLAGAAANTTGAKVWQPRVNCSSEQSRQACEQLGSVAPEVPAILPRFSGEVPTVLPRFSSIESWTSSLPEKARSLAQDHYCKTVRSISTQTLTLRPTLSAVAMPQADTQDLIAALARTAVSDLVVDAPFYQAQAPRSCRAWQLLPSVATWSALRGPPPSARPGAKVACSLGSGVANTVAHHTAQIEQTACEEESDAVELLKLFDTVLGTPLGGSCETTVSTSVAAEAEELPDLWQAEVPNRLDTSPSWVSQQQPCCQGKSLGGISDMPSPLAEPTVQSSTSQQQQQRQQQERELEQVQLQEQDHKNEPEPERQQFSNKNSGEAASLDWPLSDSNPPALLVLQAVSCDAAASEIYVPQLAMVPDAMLDHSLPTPGGENAAQEPSETQYKPLGRHRHSFSSLPSVGTWLLHAQDGPQLEVDKEAATGATIHDEPIANEKVDIGKDEIDAHKIIDAFNIAKLREDCSNDSVTCTPSTLNDCGSKRSADCAASPSLDAGAPLSFDPYAPNTLDDGKPVTDAESGECPVS